MKKVVICLSVENTRETEELKHLVDHEFLKNKEVHFVTIFKRQKFFNEPSFYEFPREEQMADIENSVIDVQKNIAESILSPDGMNHTKFLCLFDANPKIAIKNYLENSGADLVVTSIRKHGVEGLFVSSFTDYLTQYAPCDVYVVKHQ